MTDRYAVIIDKPVPRLVYGPILLLAPHEQATIIGHFSDLELAKTFVASAREFDIRLNMGLGRLRVYDHATSSVIHEMQG